MRQNTDIQAELKAIGSDLSAQLTENVYVAPTGYFEGLADAILNRIRAHADYQSGSEELAELSPLLHSLKRELPYSVPEGYFDQPVSVPMAEKAEPAKLVSLGARKWMRYAAAAVITGALALGAYGLFFSNKTNMNPEEAIAKKIGKDIRNNDISSDDVAEFLDLTDGLESLASLDKKPEMGKAPDANLEGISDKELLDFIEILPDEMN